MRPSGKHLRVGESLEPDDKDGSARGLGCCSYLGGQRSAACEDTQSAGATGGGAGKISCISLRHCNHPPFQDKPCARSRSREIISREDQTPMQDDDSASVGSRASVLGILHCLKMLAEEADNLQLPRTRLALRKAIRACQAEQDRGKAMRIGASRRGMTLH